MRFVERDRIETPSVFGSAEARANRQRLIDLFMSGPLKRSQSRLERTFAISDHPEVKMALAELFGHRCAFCETALDEPLVYRFRPAEGAHPVTDRNWAHLYYTWLADAWQNLYPICRGCLPKDHSRFPVAGKRRSPLPNPAQLHEYAERADGRWPFFPLDETSIFVDPCYDRKLWRHFRFASDGRVLPNGANRRGRETIAHFNLNRADLAKARVAAFESYHQDLIDLLAQAQGNAQGDGGKSRPLTPSPSQFPGAWFLHLRALLAAALDRTPSEDLERLAGELSRRPDWRQRLDLARDTLRAPPTAAGSPAGQDQPSDEDPREPKSIVIRNFKSLELVEVAMPLPETSGEPRAAALLILGENAAGKSTILEAIAITLMSPLVRRRLNLKSDRLVLNPRYLGAEDADRPESASVELIYGPSDMQRLRVMPTSADSGGRHIPEDFQTIGAANPLPLFGYGAYRQYLDAEREFTPHKHVRTMFETNQPLSNPERWLLRLRQTEFNMVVRALREVFSIEGEFDVLERKDGQVFVVQRLGDPDNGPVQRTPIAIVSSGFRAVLAMLCDIMHGLMDKRVNPHFQTLETARGIVLIDEIEAHLHPRWKMAIMTGLRRALPQVTFIATSHDPLCLRGMHSNEVLVLERIPGEQADTALPVFTQALVDLPDNRNWTVEQLLTADFFQLRSTASVDAERRMAKMQDKLAAGVKPADDPELGGYLAEISSSLPIGDTEVHRLVQDAIAAFLAERRKATRERLATLRKETRDAIVTALRGAA